MAINPNSYVIAVIGGKGGVGKSVFSVNLAMSLIKDLRAKVLLIDLDQRSCGDQNILTGLRPKKTVNEIATFTGSINPQSIDTLISTHPSGLGYIGAVQSPDQSLSAPAGAFKTQLYALSQFYNFIVLDLGNDFTDLQYAALDEASIVLTLTTPEVLAVNQTKRLVHDLIAKSLPADYFNIVVNGTGRAGLDPQLIGQNIGRPIIGLIPQDDVTVYSSIQRSTPFVISNKNAPVSLAYTEITRRLSGGILQKLKSLNKPKKLSENANSLDANEGHTSVGAAPADKSKNPETLLKLQIHSALIKEMDLKKDATNTKGDPAKEKELRNKTQKVISLITDRIGNHLSREDRTRIIKQVLDEALGLGPLEELLADPSVTEIMVNGCDHIYIEKNGKLTLSKVTFTSNLQLRNVIERIVTPLGRRIDEKTPYCDARLADGSRVNAVIEPLSIDGPAVTIRKFPTDRITVSDYTGRFNAMTPAMADFLKICVEQGLNIIISGGTGSGKTTLLNTMSGFIPPTERIITVEDAAELQLKQDHVVRLETRPSNMEGTGAISIRDLVRNALRMRPDRIVVGECRDGAALDMLAAMNTGHDGSMTTVHANTPREAISRLETLCLMAGMDLPAASIRQQIAGAVHLIVQISRFSDGSRKLSSITEVVGMQGEAITTQEIFRFKEEGFDKNRKVIGQFQAMGMIPTFIQKFEQRGITVPRTLFTTTSSESNKPAVATSNPSKPNPTKPSPQNTRTVPTPSGIKKTGSEGGRS